MKVAGASFIAVVSRWAEEVFKSRYPTQQHKAVLVHCGLEPAWLNRTEPAPHVGSQLVCVARLDTQKNPHLLLDASEQLAKRGVDFRLRFVGDGELRAAMEERVSKSNLAHRITFDGWASPSLVEEALCTARALVLSSDDEGLPVAIMEAFALGRPVVATDVAAVHELVETGVTGWLVPRRDADALADAMASALRASPEELRRLGTEGLRRVQRHDVRLSAQAMSDALHGALR
jgi:glycosyltransferase involved in cell wall biosynthesis